MVRDWQLPPSPPPAPLTKGKYYMGEIGFEDSEMVSGVLLLKREVAVNKSPCFHSIKAVSVM